MLMKARGMNHGGFLAPVYMNTNVITLERCFFPSFFPKSASVGETARPVSPIVILCSQMGVKWLTVVTARSLL